MRDQVPTSALPAEFLVNSKLYACTGAQVINMPVHTVSLRDVLFN